MVRLISLAVLLAVASGCTTIDDNPTLSSAPNYNPPTGLRAVSADGGVWLVWHPAPGKDSANFISYRIVPSVGPILQPSQDVAKTDTSVFVPGLTNGVAYTFVMRSVAVDHTTGPASLPLVWAPAPRTTGLRLYAFTPDSGVADALVLDVTGARVVHSGGGVGDVVMQGGTLMGAAALDSTVTGATRFAAGAMRDGTGLDDLSFAAAGVDTTVYSFDSALLAQGSAQTGSMLAVRGRTGLFARIFVHRDSTGNPVMIDTSSSNTRSFVLLDVSLQTTDTLSYSRPGPHAGSGGRSR